MQMEAEVNGTMNKAVISNILARSKNGRHLLAQEQDNSKSAKVTNHANEMARCKNDLFGRFSLER